MLRYTRCPKAHLKTIKVPQVLQHLDSRFLGHSKVCSPSEHLRGEAPSFSRKGRGREGSGASSGTAGCGRAVLYLEAGMRTASLVPGTPGKHPESNERNWAMSWHNPLVV